ncbi:hypothetical protein A0J61_11791, partial [Choanephora cucurbitarum]
MQFMQVEIRRSDIAICEMNSTAYCNGCKRSFSSPQNLKNIARNKSVFTTSTTQVVEQSVEQSVEQPVEQTVEQPAVQPIVSNISSPMAGISPIEEDVEPLA